MVNDLLKIPLHPPLSKGEILSPPFFKGRLGGISKGLNFYNWYNMNKTRSKF